MLEQPSLPAGFTHQTISSGMRASGERTPDKTALLFEDRQLSYRALIERTNRLANALSADAGVGPGDHVAILAPNCLEYFEVVCAVSDLGAVIVTLNPRLTAAEVRAVLADAEASVLIVHPSCADSIAADSLPGAVRVVTIDDTYESWLARAPAAFEPGDVAEWTPFCLPYTSGTTGKPKGVLLSHRSRTAGFYGNAAEFGCYGIRDRFCAITPLCHGAGFAFAMCAVYFGGTCEIMAGFDPELLLRRLHEGETTGTFLVPTQLHAIFELDRKTLDAYRGHKLRALLCNAAALPTATKLEVLDYFGEDVLFELYGSTEAGVVSCLRPEDQRRKENCVGPAFQANRVRLLNEHGAPAAPGDVGELFSRSPYLFNGYWNRQAETEATFSDGWVSVGDLARMDDEGYLYIEGRKSEIVISGGVNIYPREIEEALALHESVSEAAVVGRPDDKWGESLVAFVSLTRQGAADRETLDAYCRERLASYKIPKDWRFVDKLPRSATGKILKKELM